jgi:hypothetical protein
MALVHRVGWDARFMERSPWLWPIARAAERLSGCTAFPTHAELDALYAELAQAAGRGACSLRFRPDVRARRGAGTAQVEDCYDGRIALRGEVPTREGHWHDLLNALCFATFPRSKYALHARQCALLAQRGGPQRTRTPEQDALTLFDEGGVVIAARAETADALREALAGGGGEDLVAAQRAGLARVVPFGHALFEHLVEGVPCPGASARVLAFDDITADDGSLLAAIDGALAAELENGARFLRPREAAHVRLDALGPPG